MNFAGCKPFAVPRFGSFCDHDDAVNFPLGIGVVVRNMRFLMQGVATRYGTKATMTDGTVRVTGLANLRFIGTGTSVPLRFDSAGVLKKESPSGSGTLLPVTSTLVSPPSASYMQSAIAYNRAWLAWTDLLKGTAYPSVYDGLTGSLDPVSLRKVGELWTASTAVVIGEVWSPTTANGHLFRCTTAGTTGGSEPSWNTGTGSTTSDNTVVWTEITPAATSAVAAGNICTGVRYFAVLFETRTGYISGFTQAAVFAANIVSANKQITISNIPLGPANVTRRIIAFGVPGDSQAGRFFYVPADDNPGVTITATVVPDNTTTSATFNFTDQYLVKLADTEVSDFFLKFKVPQCLDVAYLPSQDAIAYTGAVGYESGILVSPRTDPETVNGGESIVQVGENDGEKMVCVRELRTGEILAFKDDSVHAVSAADGVPSTWNVVPRWRKAGACGPRAVDIANKFTIFAHRSGVWMYEAGQGATGFSCVSDEIRNTWASINWNAKHLIWVHIDETLKEVRIGIPLGTSIIPNKVLTLSYLTGWQQPLYINMFGKLMVAHESRKWSIDDIPAHQALSVERDLTVSVDPRIDHEQILLASALNDGRVNMIVPDLYDDNASGINSVYQVGFAHENSLAVLQFGGCTFTARGSGGLAFNPETDDTTDIYAPRTVNLSSTLQRYVDGAQGLNEYFGYSFASDGLPGSWFQLDDVVMYAKPKWGARPA